MHLNGMPESTINHENNAFEKNAQLSISKIIAHKISFIIYKTTKMAI